MSTRENPSSAHAPVVADGPEGSPPGGRLGRKTLLIAAIGVAIVLLAGGGVFAMWSRGAASDASEEANSSASSQAAKKPKSAKPTAKEGKEGKSKHGAKEEKKGAKEDKKKESKTEDKSAHAKKPAKENKHAGKEAKTEKGHAKPGSDKVAEGGKHSKEGKKEGKHAKPGKEEKPSDATGEGKHDAEGSSELAEADDQPAYLGKGQARLGLFSVKIFDPLTHTMLRTDFGLEAVIACEDQAEFERFLRSSQQFLREQVMVAMRTSDAVDFADRSLQLVKRRIVARVNRALGRPFLKSVELKNFTVYESVENSPYVRWQPAAAEGP